MSDIKIAVIGSGFAGMACASVMAQNGYDVTVYEKNDQPGGRARVWEKDGFKFDMGPSWYWMPDVFENFFALFGKKVSDYYHLKRLDPGYRVYFDKNDFVDVPAQMDELENLFDSIEPGSSIQLRKFLAQAKYKYEVGMKEYVFKPSHSITEYFDLKLIRNSLNIQLLTSMSAHVRSYFKNQRLIEILEFPVLFLGATPQNTPALYSMMNYADLALGTWYPQGGMHEISHAMFCLATELGVKFKFNTEVKKIIVNNSVAESLETDKGIFSANFIISNADYQHTDQTLIDKPWNNYQSDYWESRTMSPSSLLFYIGLNKTVPGIQHHNLFFDEDFNQHAAEIYAKPQWPTKPLFYVSAPSKTDDTVAPAGCENLFFLMPLAPGLEDTEELRELYFKKLINRFESTTGQSISDSILFKRSYCVNDFISDYNSFKGNAYGLANTLRQTAFLKPKMRASKIKNLLFTGQLTVPGPGVPPAIISGQVAAKEALRYLDNFS
ncbi:phytoene desaturase [Pedobacter sp. HMF7647]|uniref:Phytoene desaturase n=1 Tax=Hufsiella arboris TaxID=2695275 RepID=A0A7K1YG49_9SPHI|nr:phytoene desaturase family protein [Hufsiella arboris]MXV52969.1 phytoene desaturase [Hufsiella arboris]